MLSEFNSREKSLHRSRGAAVGPRSSSPRVAYVNAFVVSSGTAGIGVIVAAAAVLRGPNGRGGRCVGRRAAPPAAGGGGPNVGRVEIMFSRLQGGASIDSVRF